MKWRRTVGGLAALTSTAASVGAVQLVTGTYVPPTSDLAPLGLDSWVVPGVWLAVSVALPCAVVALLAWRRSPRSGRAAVLAGALLLLELLVQIPYVGTDPLQAVMGTVAVVLILLGADSSWSVSPESGRAPGGVDPRDARRWLVGALLGGAVLVALDEEVLWAGQPASGATSDQIAAWYQDHAPGVLAGDLLWIGACVLLLLGLLGGIELIDARLGHWIRPGAWIAAGVLAISAVAAAVLALGVPMRSARTGWLLEQQCFVAGAAVLSVVVVLSAVGDLRRGRRIMAAAGTVVAVLLVVGPTRYPALLATFLLVAARLARESHRSAGDSVAPVRATVLQ